MPLQTACSLDALLVWFDVIPFRQAPAGCGFGGCCGAFGGWSAAFLQLSRLFLAHASTPPCRPAYPAFFPFLAWWCGPDPFLV
jgi:hypothetical protein